MRDLRHRGGRRAGKRLGHQRIDRLVRVPVRAEPGHDFPGLGREFLFRQRGEQEPGREDGVMLFAPLVEPGNPMLHDAGVEFAFPRERFGFGFVVEPLRLERGQQIIACALAQLGERVVFPGPAEVFQFAFAFLALGLVFIVLPGQGSRSQQRLVLRLVATREHAVKRVIVLGRNRIVFMIVTTGARDGQSQQSARDHVDAVVNDVRLIVQKTAAKGQKAHGGERPFVGSQIELVGRKLLEDEPVEREVFVERTNDIVAIRVGVGVATLLLEHVALGVGVTGHIEPVTTPPLAVTRRAKQTIHDSGISFG